MIKKEKENQNQKQTDSTEHIHKNQKWIKKARINAQKKLTPEMFKVYCDYSDELLLNSHSLAGRKKLLVQFVSVVNNFKIKDLKTITAEEIKQIVIEIMVKHSDNGKETWYSQDLKKVLRQMIRFAKTGSHLLPEEGELPELKQIKCKKIEDKLSRSDMPTKEDCDKILKACGTNLMDRAMFHVQMDAATRVGELLSLCLKHIEFDEYGALIAVDGKTGARKIRIVESVPDLIKWINVHPFREDRSHPLFITTINNKYYGQGLSYVAFKRRLQNVVAKTDIDKRIHSHLFRHAEITKRATQLTEAQARIRYGWGKSSNMPSRYTHLNDKDVDDKMLQIMGVKKKEVEEETSIIECQYCHVKYSKDTLYCETCAKPLDVVEAERMKQQQKEENEIMISELIRKEKSRESNKKYYNKRGEELENKIESQKEEIQSLKDLISKIGKAE